MALIVGVIVIIVMMFSMPTYAKKYGSELCQDSNIYYCYKVKKSETWKTLFPDEAQRDLVMRINRINTPLYAGLVLTIPRNPHGQMLDYSPLPSQIDPPGEKLIYVDMSEHFFGAYDANGLLHYWGPVSGGKGYCSDIGRGCHTPYGNFTIQSKRGKGCYSSKFPVGKGGAPMPYCMFFRGGFALHGSYIVPGYHDSHGCVRLFINDARWLNQEFTADGNTRVKIVE